MPKSFSICRKRPRNRGQIEAKVSFSTFPKNIKEAILKHAIPTVSLMKINREVRGYHLRNGLFEKRPKEIRFWFEIMDRWENECLRMDITGSEETKRDISIHFNQFEIRLNDKVNGKKICGLVLSRIRKDRIERSRRSAPLANQNSSLTFERHFLRFLSKLEPFSIVFDGYSTKGQKKTNESLMEIEQICGKIRLFRELNLKLFLNRTFSSLNLATNFFKWNFSNLVLNFQTSWQSPENIGEFCRNGFVEMIENKSCERIFLDVVNLESVYESFSKIPKKIEWIFLQFSLSQTADFQEIIEKVLSIENNCVLSCRTFQFQQEDYQNLTRIIAERNGIKNDDSGNDNDNDNDNGNDNDKQLPDELKNLTENSSIDWKRKFFSFQDSSKGFQKMIDVLFNENNSLTNLYNLYIVIKNI